MRTFSGFQIPISTLNFPQLIMKLAPTIAILGSLLTVGSLHAKWSRIPTVMEKPVNTISGLASNATLDSSAGFGQVDALLSSDITANANVSSGKSFVVINLGKPVMIARSSFVSDGIEGRATLSASADKSGWAVLEERIITAADRNVDFKFAGIQAKYVKLELALSKGGMIRFLQIFGAATDKGYAVKQSADGKGGKPMDLINGLGGARVIYAAPKPANGLDNAITYNKFSFPESDEKYRTVIYDFGQLRILNEFASVHSPRPVRFEVFAFDSLPEKEDWRGRMAFDPSDFGSAHPVAVAEDTRGLGELKAKPQKPVKTRYLAMRWEPEFNPPNFEATGGSSGNGEIYTTTTTTVTNPTTGVTTVTTTTVGTAPGAGSSSSPVTPDNPGQQSSQGSAQSGDSTTVTTSTYAPGVNPSTPGATPTTTTTTTGNTTTTETNTPGGGSVTSTSTKGTDSSGNPVTTTTTVTTTPDGQTTTSTVTTDSNGNTVNTPSGTPTNPNQQSGSGTTTGTNSNGNLGGGSSPAPNGGGGLNANSTNTNSTAPAVTSP